MPKLSQKNFLILLPILVILITFPTFFYFVQNNSNSNQNKNSKPISSAVSPDNSELKPLVADAEHDVVVLKECDLVMRFEKIGRLNNSAKLSRTELDGEITYIYGTPNTGSYAFWISCLEKNNNSYKEKVYTDYLPELKLSSLDNLKSLEAGTTVVFYSFENSKSISKYKYYTLSQGPTALQIQPNSLAPSTPSVKL